MTPDLTECALHVAALAGRPDARMTWQTVPRDHDRHHPQTHHGTLAEVAPTLRRLAKRRDAVYITPNATDFTGRKAHNITKIRACFVDIDDGAPRRGHLDPSLVVRSGGRDQDGRYKRHMYWILASDHPPVDPDLWRQVQRRLIRYYRSDRSIHDLPRVMRAAGWPHWGGAEPARAQISHYAPWRRYSIEQITADLPKLPTPPPRPAAPPVVSGGARWRAVDAVSAFTDAGYYGRPLEDRKHAVLCPWWSEHTRSDTTGERGDTVLWERDERGPARFHCSHDHCEGRFLSHALAALGATAR